MSRWYENAAAETQFAIFFREAETFANYICSRSLRSECIARTLGQDFLPRVTRRKITSTLLCFYTRGMSILCLNDFLMDRFFPFWFLRDHKFSSDTKSDFCFLLASRERMRKLLTSHSAKNCFFYCLFYSQTRSRLKPTHDSYVFYVQLFVRVDVENYCWNSRGTSICASTDQ